MTTADLEAIVARETGWDNPLRRSALYRLRYRCNESVRLDRINRQRARRGKALALSLDETSARLPI